jgi:hypothetical protein
VVQRKVAPWWALLTFVVIAIVVATMVVVVLRICDSGTPPLAVTISRESGGCVEEETSCGGSTARLVRAVDRVTTETRSDLQIFLEDGRAFAIRDMMYGADWQDPLRLVAVGRGREICRVDLTGEKPVITPTGARGFVPRVNKDGDIAFIDEGRMKVLLVDGAIANVSTGARGDCDRHEWSGKTLMFASHMPGETDAWHKWGG